MSALATISPQTADDRRAMLNLAHALKALTGCSDPLELREAVSEWGGYPDDVCLTIDGMEWRFINDDVIDQIMQDELESDTYMLGCFNAWFLADILGTSTDAIEAIQKAEAYEGLGEMVLAGGHLEKLQKAYASADGYGHHFSGYDGNGEEFTLESGDIYHAFRIG